MAKCCDEWWASLPDALKEYVHYYHYDILDILKDFPHKDLKGMHDFRFNVELGGKKNCPIRR